MKKIIFVFSLFILFYLLPATYYVLPTISVSAHPVDQIGISVYDQKQTLTVSPEKTTLQIDLTFYALEKIKLWSSINTGLDQQLSSTEKDVWMRVGSEASWLTVFGKKYEFAATRVTIPEYDEFFSAKPVNIVISFTAKVSIKPGNTVTYFYQGKDKKLSEIPFAVRGSDGLDVTNLISNASDNRTFTIAGGGASLSRKSTVIHSNRLNRFLDTYVKVNAISINLFFVAIAVSFLIGALHALTPGHGKSIVAGYLVGEKGTIRHALGLGVIITLTHTVSVFLLGIGTLFLTQYIVPTVVISWISMLSGFMIAGLGLYLLLTRIKEYASIHHHKHTEHVHDLSWKNLLALGISGGLVPCVDALAILIVAISLGKILFGLTLLFVFSLGLASMLIAGGILVVIMKKRVLRKFNDIEKFEKYSAIFSACVITILGIAILIGKPL